jgi:hypothetical protein
LLIGERAHRTAVGVKDVEDPQDDRSAGRSSTIAAETGGDGAEAGMTVGVECDELAVEQEAARAQLGAQGGELGEFVGGVAAGASTECQPASIYAGLGADPVPFDLEDPALSRGGGERGAAREHRFDEPWELFAHRYGRSVMEVSGWIWESGFPDGSSGPVAIMR